MWKISSRKQNTPPEYVTLKYNGLWDETFLHRYPADVIQWHRQTELLFPARCLPHFTKMKERINIYQLFILRLCNGQRYLGLNLHYTNLYWPVYSFRCLWSLADDPLLISQLHVTSDVHKSSRFNFWLTTYPELIMEEELQKQFTGEPQSKINFWFLHHLSRHSPISYFLKF